MLKACLIGFGGITGAHINGYKKLFEEKKIMFLVVSNAGYSQYFSSNL